MNITSLIAEHLLAVHEGNNWTEVNIADVLKDVTAEEAATRTPASPNTIEALVRHITYWNRVMVQRINGIKVEIPEDNGFEIGDTLTDADWKHLREDNIASAHELATVIINVAESRLPEPILKEYSSTYKNLQGTVEHIHYHLGQLMLIKQLVRALKVNAI
jgi:hypothetical protein